MTRTDTGNTQACKIDAPVQILHGCGVGPMIAMNDSNLLALVSQAEQDKTVRLYKMQDSWLVFILL